MHLRSWLFPGIFAGAVFGSLLAAPLIAQQTPSPSGGIVDGTFTAVHFERWVAEGHTKQIPWHLEIRSPRLSSHQRIAAQVLISVPSREFFQRPGLARLKAFLQITDTQSRVFQSHLSLTPRKQKTLSPGTEVRFQWGVFLLPGEYHLAVAFADTKTGAHNFAQKTLRVKPLKNDPLPDVWNGLPEVEFFGTEGDLEEAYLPDVATALNLSLVPTHPVDLHILVNVAVPDRPATFGRGPVAASRTAYMRSLRDLLPIVKILGQLPLERGTKGLEVVDATRRQVIFTQNGFHSLDWYRMETTLQAVNPAIIDVKSLQQRTLNAAFIRDQVLELLRPSGDASPGRARVVILLSHEMDLSHNKKLPLATLPANCNCQVFYLRLRPAFLFGYRDDIGQALEGLKPLAFSADSPKSFRKALAEIIARISRM